MSKYEPTSFDYAYIYIYRFHWILIIIIPDRSAVYIMDSLRKPRNEYKNLIDTLKKAWACFRQQHVGEFKEKLDFKAEFPVCTKFSHLVSLPY